eukprot:403363309
MDQKDEVYQSNEYSSFDQQNDTAVLDQQADVQEHGNCLPDEAVKKYESFSIADLQKPFPTKGLNTITIRPIVGVINDSQVDQLGQIQEQSDLDSDQDYDATQKPEVMAKNSDQKYITANYTNQKEETTAITQNSDSNEYSDMHVPNSLEGERKYLEKITELYKLEYGDDENEIKNRIQHNLRNTSINRVTQLNEDNIKHYVETTSFGFSKVLEVKKIAQGGEAIVFRLEHQGTNEVVIKTSLKIQNETDNDDSESPFIDLMAETRHLRLLQSEKYIASVKEEIIEWRISRLKWEILELVQNQINLEMKMKNFIHQKA